ncbi:hypothetical protein K438DRAFT_1779217 [Mycena galopus ATCC 62051]|nr:hypothetical protein K438DRAFT_1779217 [Mycena galopus ATCC 62051]
MPAGWCPQLHNRLYCPQPSVLGMPTYYTVLASVCVSVSVRRAVVPRGLRLAASKAVWIRLDDLADETECLPFYSNWPMRLKDMRSFRWADAKSFKSLSGYMDAQKTVAVGEKETENAKEMTRTKKSRIRLEGKEQNLTRRKRKELKFDCANNSEDLDAAV